MTTLLPVAIFGFLVAVVGFFLMERERRASKQQQEQPPGRPTGGR